LTEVEWLANGRISHMEVAPDCKDQEGDWALPDLFV